MPKLVIGVAVVIAISSSASVGRAQTATMMTTNDAVYILRLVGSAEVGLMAQGGAGELGEVLRAPEWPKSADLKLPVTPVDSSTATIRDYTLRVVRSSDRKHFSAKA